MTKLERGSAADAGFRQAFAEVPRAVREAPYEKFLPPPDQWVKHLEIAGPDAAFWIAQREGAPAGRIGASVSPTRPGVGYVGYFEADLGGDPEVSKDLLDAALGWLRERGVTKAYGPIDRSTWYSYRFRVDPHPDDSFPATEEPFAWEPWQPPGYVRAFAAASFVEVERYHSHGYRGVDGMRLTDATELIRPMADFAHSQGYRMERFSENWDDVIRDLYDVGNICFAKNFLFEPISWEEFVPLYAGVGPKIDYRPSSWMIDPQGAKRGFMLAYVDRGYVVMKTVGVAPELRRGGLSLALLWFACQRGLELGLDATLAALFKRGNASEGMLRTGFSGATAWRHDYALFERTLA